MANRCRIEDIYAVAEALNESLDIQEPYRRPTVGDGALLLTKNATDTRWFHALADHATAICFPCGRLKETTTMQGPALFYFGAHVEAFARLCAPIGFVVERKKGRDGKNARAISGVASFEPVEDEIMGPHDHPDYYWRDVEEVEFARGLWPTTLETSTTTEDVHDGDGRHDDPDEW